MLRLKVSGRIAPIRLVSAVALGALASSLRSLLPPSASLAVSASPAPSPCSALGSARSAGFGSLRFALLAPLSPPSSRFARLVSALAALRLSCPFSGALRPVVSFALLRRRPCFANFPISLPLRSASSWRSLRSLFFFDKFSSTFFSSAKKKSSTKPNFSLVKLAPYPLQPPLHTEYSLVTTWCLLCHIYQIYPLTLSSSIDIL